MRVTIIQSQKLVTWSLSPFYRDMAPSIHYHCPCLSTSPVPPPPNLLSSSYSFHPLHALFFCEECDAVRCNRCVSVEVSGYYCPNCLFEVPSASVRAEKNRYALTSRCEKFIFSFVPVDVHEIASCALIAGTHYLSFLQTHRKIQLHHLLSQ